MNKRKAPALPNGSYRDSQKDHVTTLFRSLLTERTSDSAKIYTLRYNGRTR